MGRTPARAQKYGTAQAVIGLGRFASLALVLGSLYLFDANPRVLLFAFILSTVAHTFQIKWLLHLGRSPRYRGFVEGRTRAPTQTETEWAKNYIGQENAATTVSSVLLLIGGLTLFAFMLSHVDHYKELDFELPRFLGEMIHALALTAIYVIENLVLRETALDLDQSEAMNLHYGSQRITALALAVLFAGGAIAYFQTAGKEVSPWVIMGPLIVLKELFDARARFGSDLR